MNTLEPERKKSTLGQFRPKTGMRGRWVGWAALACVAVSFLLNEFWGMIPGLILAVAAIVVGKIGLDSKGRSVALIALVAGVLLIGIYLTILVVGPENIGIDPS